MASTGPHPSEDDKQILDVSVFAPRATEPKTFHWNKHLTVGEAADEAAQAFGYVGGTPSLAKGDEVRDDDTLELVDTGGGV
jgi:hypothetical protein